MKFGLADYLILAGYFLSLGLIGWRAARREKGTDDYFLGGRRMPWWAVTLSILATEVSAVTFIGAPGESYRGNYAYLQFAFGSLLGRILIALLFLPAFYKGGVTSIYEYLGQRFGNRSRLTAASFFFVTRLLASGVRLLIVSLALSVVTGFPLVPIVVAVALIALCYTLLGGIKAVIWTDVLQFGVFMGGALVAVFFLLREVPGGWEGLRSQLDPARFKVFDFSFSLTSSTIFWVALVNGCIQTFAALGTDQDLTQRMLTCRRLGEGQRALILTGFLDFPVVLVYLVLGSCLFYFYRTVGSPLPAHIAADLDTVFPHFIVTVLPAGVRGLLIASIFAAAMSSLDSAINAMASSAVMDVYKPFIRPGASETHYLKASRYFVVAFCILLVISALLLDQLEGGKLWLGFKVTGFTYGAMLGVFLLGVVTRGGSDRANLWAMLSSTAVLILLAVSDEFDWLGKGTLLAWPWYIAVGTGWTFLAGFLFRPRRLSI